MLSLAELTHGAMRPMTRDGARVSGGGARNPIPCVLPKA